MTSPTRQSVVAAVVERNGRYLLCRRPAHKRHGGLWEFPGGKVLEGESRADAIARELTEELDLVTVRVGDVLASEADVGSDFVIEFVPTVTEGGAVLHEHDELGWFSPDELRALPLAPADARFAARLEA